jgi:hypothetical protein
MKNLGFKSHRRILRDVLIKSNSPCKKLSSETIKLQFPTNFESSPTIRCGGFEIWFAFNDGLAA